jgi:type IV secretory pathway VirJ component
MRSPALCSLLLLSLATCRRGSGPSVHARELPDTSRRTEAAPGPLRVDTVRLGRFGPVVLYRRSEHPPRVVLFVSGDGGWNRGVVDMARALSELDALIVGVDIRRYLASLAAVHGSCGYPAADFEALSQSVQQRLGYPVYVAPVLVGYSSGATFVYAVLAQAPPGTFRAGVSLGFCPDLRLATPLCRGNGLSAGPGSRGAVRFNPMDSMRTPWVVLQGSQDSTCFLSQADSFVRATRGAEIVRLPSVGHGFGVEAHWLPQLREVVDRVSRAPVARAPLAPSVRDLPLVELPAHGTSGELAVIVSGDGGWASIDRRIGEDLAAHDVPVVGLNALQYFWHARTPDETGRDLARILTHYLDAWKAADVLLIGYSLGADVLPFMVSRLPPDLRARVRLVGLIAPGRSATFEFHVSQWLGAAKPGAATAPEIGRLTGLRILCVYGTDDRDSVCPLLPKGSATVLPLQGGHHFGGSYGGIAERILEAARGG